MTRPPTREEMDAWEMLQLRQERDLWTSFLDREEWVIHERDKKRYRVIVARLNAEMARRIPHDA